MKITLNKKVLGADVVIAFETLAQAERFKDGFEKLVKELKGE